MNEPRAAWVKSSVVSPEQRMRFHLILKMKKDATNRFIDLVQDQILDYVLGNKMLLNSPPESAEVTRERLTNIAEHAKMLWEELSSLDEDGSGHRLLRAQLKLNHPTFDPGELVEPLMFLAVIAGGAAQWESERPPGRPPNIPNYRFIVGCVDSYIHIFQELPKYTKGTKFQNFLIAISEEFCPPEMALRGDITKTIQAAIEYGESKK